LRFKFGYFFNVEKEREDVLPGKAAGASTRPAVYPPLSQALSSREAARTSLNEARTGFPEGLQVKILPDGNSSRNEAGIRRSQLEQKRDEKLGLRSSSASTGTRGRGSKRQRTKSSRSAFSLIHSVATVIGETTLAVSERWRLKSIEWQNTVPTEGTVTK
jgi:hypothetical protein